MRTSICKVVPAAFKAVSALDATHAPAYGYAIKTAQQLVDPEHPAAEVQVYVGVVEILFYNLLIKIQIFLRINFSNNC